MPSAPDRPLAAYIDSMERINKTLAAAGYGSRRACEELIRAGRVSINGRRVTELGQRVGPRDEVAVDNQAIVREKLVYWLVNKPKGYLCTNHDPAGRPRVVDLLEHVPQRVYTVGRLDEESEGLLLLTNDGDLALKLTHPRYGIEKTYNVQVAGDAGHDLVQQMLAGVRLSDGLARAKKVSRLGHQGKSTFLRVVLAEGKNREIRRMLAKLGHKVISLTRIGIGPLQLGQLKRGKCRRVSTVELEKLKALTKPARPRATRTSTPSAKST
jgi:23S rRNA pseudouridine2605 synthase